MRSRRVEDTADAVIVERLSDNTEHFLHRPRLGLVLHSRQRGRRRQAVTDEGLNNLAMGEDRHIAHRAEPIDDPCDIQPPGELRNHRQRPQRLLDARRPIIPSMSFTHTTSSRPLPAPDLNLQNF